MSADEILDFERVLAQTLRSPNAVTALRELLADEKYASWRAEFGLDHLTTDDAQAGFKIAALLIAKLRFSRLMQGSRIAPTWFETDPRGFAEEFKRYHADVPPLDFYPQGEGETFDRYE